MDAINWLYDHIESLDINEIFETSEEFGWIWVNRTVFSDIFYSLGFEVEEDENEAAIFEALDENEVFDILEKTFKKSGYVRVNQFLFSNWDLNFKPTRDMGTIIFIKKEFHQKISIYCQNKFGWFLKAISLDTYFKVNSEFPSITECYEELYEGNYRIVEDILSYKNYQYMSGKWEYVPSDGILLFYKGSKFMNSWTEQEAESFYNEVTLAQNN